MAQWETSSDESDETSVARPLGGPLLTAVAQQADGFNHVVVKDMGGYTVHRIPNGERVEIRADVDEDIPTVSGKVDNNTGDEQTNEGTWCLVLRVLDANDQEAELQA